jgi:hypothetical protein
LGREAGSRPLNQFAGEQHPSPDMSPQANLRGAALAPLGEILGRKDADYEIEGGD